jgi:hypothetical protein
VRQDLRGDFDVSEEGKSFRRESFLIGTRGRKSAFEQPAFASQSEVMWVAVGFEPTERQGAKPTSRSDA